MNIKPLLKMIVMLLLAAVVGSIILWGFWNYFFPGTNPTLVAIITAAIGAVIGSTITFHYLPKIYK